MPLYMCNAKKGTLSDAAKQKIAADITRIHCEVTNAPPDFVHAFFFEEATHMPLDGKSAFLFGTIRGGRNDGQKQRISEEMTRSIHTHADIPLDEIAPMILDVPASWTMEGGDILPEPGEEAEWLKAHAKKLAAAG